MLFGPRHDILELPQLPRERGVLQAVINEARHQRKKSRLVRWAAGNITVWALYILVVWTPMHRPAAPVQAHTSSHRSYLPMLLQRNK